MTVHLIPAAPKTLMERLRYEAKDVRHYGDGTLEVFVYAVVRVWEVFAESLKDSGLVKKYASLVAYSVQWMQTFEVPPGRVLGIISKDLSAVKTVLAGLEAITKLETCVMKPLRKRTVIHFSEQPTQGVCAKDAHHKTILNIAPAPEGQQGGNGVQAPVASVWEKTAKKAAQISDFSFSAMDLVHYGLKSGILTLTKETVAWLKEGMAYLQTIAGFIMSLQGLYEEGGKLITGNYVRDKDGCVWKMQFDDQVLSCIRIAMCTAYFVIGVLGALALAGYLVPYALTLNLACLTVATGTNLMAHYWEKICVDTNGRSKIPEIGTAAVTA